MYRPTCRFLIVTALLLVVSGCGGDDDTPTTPPPAPRDPDSFSGVLAQNGVTIHPFTVTGPSQITAQLVSLTPNSDKVIGMGLGTWNGSICQVVLDNAATKQGDVVEGATQTVGEFCLRVYDPNGSIVPAQLYVVLVHHQ